MANFRILTRKQGNQRFILAQGHARKPPDAAIGRAGKAKARARDRGVMRPRIVFKRVKQPRQFGEQSLIRVLKLTTPMKRIGQELAFAVEIDTSQNRVSATLECGEVRRDPIRRHLAVGVRGQDHATRVASFHQPSLGNVHSRAPRIAGVGGRRRQSRFNHADVERQISAKLSSQARTLISAIVGENDDADERRRNRPSGPIALMSKRPQAGRQALFFIFDRYGDDKAWPDG
jgi:hypothetical protein